VTTVAASLAHLAYMVGPVIPDIWWKPILVYAGWFLIIINVALWLRSVLTFGVDNIALVYVYFPQEGRFVNSSIYSILRHPVYSAILHISIGLALISANWYSLLVAILLPLGFAGWVRLIEEKELIERFGQSYLDYRKSTPAFWVKPRDWVKFFRFLISGN
jgi:protein-S-isoprenylcysteine O-methyltransferase Ste14